MNTFSQKFQFVQLLNRGLRLSTQNVVAPLVEDIDGEKICAYLNDKGSKCIVGAMISDEDYDPSIESHCAADKIVIDALELGLGFRPDRADITLLTRIQRQHDVCVAGQFKPYEISKIEVLGRVQEIIETWWRGVAYDGLHG